MAAIPPKQLRSIQHYTVVNSIFHLQIYKIGFSFLLTRLKSQYTDNIGILLPVYRYRIFLIPSDPTVHKSYIVLVALSCSNPGPFPIFCIQSLHGIPFSGQKLGNINSHFTPCKRTIVLSSEFFVPPPYLSRMAHPSIGLMRY